MLAWKRLLAEALWICLEAEVMRRLCVYTGAELDEDDEHVLFEVGSVMANHDRGVGPRRAGEIVANGEVGI